MRTLEAIYTRRSIRQFLDKKIDEGVIEEILKAAMRAPSAYNQQPWHFVLEDDPKILEKIPLFHFEASMCREAKMGILVCGDMNRVEEPLFWEQDCSAATQNMLLAAHEKDLGAVWTLVYPVEEVVEGFRKLYSLPKEIIPFSFVVLGYPAEKKESEDRFQKNRIHYNGW